MCVGKIKHAGSQYVDDWNYLKKLLPAEYVKGMLDTMFFQERARSLMEPYKMLIKY